jgi:protein-S-isoprenylcysteine O-methyltransferase Ste14
MNSENSQRRGLLLRTAIFAYGVVAYLMFLAVFVYAIGFIGNFFVPKTLDAKPAMAWEKAILVDAALLTLFAVQHSVMARKSFKHMLTRVIPPAAERSTYVLASNIALALLFWLWQPLGALVWTVESTVGRALMYAGYGFGWALVLLATVVINHFDLFGLRQAWRGFQNKPQTALPFTTPLLYRVVRHPLYVGWLFVFWSTAEMTITHLFFAVMTTGYILVAIQLEERDLMRDHPEYAAYRRQTPMLIPRITRRVQNFADSYLRGGQVSAR